MDNDKWNTLKCKKGDIIKCDFKTFYDGKENETESKNQDSAHDPPSLNAI